MTLILDRQTCVSFGPYTSPPIVSFSLFTYMVLGTHLRRQDPTFRIRRLFYFREGTYDQLRV